MLWEKAGRMGRPAFNPKEKEAKMYYIRLFENFFIAGMDVYEDYLLHIRPNVGAGFLNAWNYYIEPY